MRKMALIISCEHAVNTVPQEYMKYFLAFKGILETHEAIDLGALTIAEYFKNKLQCVFIQAKASRLLVDCNRTISHPQCFTKVTQSLAASEKEHILDKYYYPYRQQVIDSIQKEIQLGSQILHLSIHSFTPELHGQVRQTDIGLLYDPKRSNESAFAKRWQAEFKMQAPQLKLRRNYPYKGISDGFTTALRKLLSNQDYLGIEVETNQRLVKDIQSLDFVKKALVSSLLKLL